MSVPQLKSCPICSCRRLRTVRRGRYITRRRTKPIEVRGVDYQECSRCGERFFDDATMVRIEDARGTHRSPATG